MPCHEYPLPHYFRSSPESGDSSTPLGEVDPSRQWPFLLAPGRRGNELGEPDPTVGGEDFLPAPAPAYPLPEFSTAFWRMLATAELVFNCYDPDSFICMYERPGVFVVRNSNVYDRIPDVVLCCPRHPGDVWPDTMFSLRSSYHVYLRSYGDRIGLSNFVLGDYLYRIFRSVMLRPFGMVVYFHDRPEASPFGAFIIGSDVGLLPYRVDDWWHVHPCLWNLISGDPTAAPGSFFDVLTFDNERGFDYGPTFALAGRPMDAALRISLVERIDGDDVILTIIPMGTGFVTGARVVQTVL